MTRQQHLIYTVVKNSCVHPTAEEIYREARAQMPHLGIATVYRALEKLSGDGSIRRLSVDGGPDRYDGTLSPHAHAVCRRCGRVRDVEIGDIEEQIRRAAGGSDVTVQIMIGDLCEDCAQKISVPSSKNE